MPIERANIEGITEQDLIALIETGRPESLAIEYKSKPYDKRDPKNKAEPLKDLSAFANADGGHLIIGIKDRGGVAEEICPVSNGDIEEQKNRLESMLLYGIEPTTLGVRMHPVTLRRGGSALVIRIPKSWNGPHRVEADNKRQFWIRDSKGAHEATVEELRSLFTFSTETAERIKAFRLERVALAAEDRGSSLLKYNGRMLLHLIPIAAFGRSAQIDIHKAYQMDLSANYETRSLFAPLGRYGSRPRYNLDGMINLGGSDKTGYTQIFRNGILESATSQILDGSKSSRLLVSHVNNLIKGICTYLDGLEALDVLPPLAVMVTYQGIQDAALLQRRYDTHPDPEEAGRFPRSDPIILPDVIIDEYGSHRDYQRAVRPIFDALWNAAGYPRCSLYNEEGVYTN